MSCSNRYFYFVKIVSSTEKTLCFPPHALWTDSIKLKLDVFDNYEYIIIHLVLTESCVLCSSPDTFQILNKTNDVTWKNTFMGACGK